MTESSSDLEISKGSSLPGLMGEYTDEELNQHTIKHAKYFTVVQINRGGFVKGGTNYNRFQVDTLDDARTMAKDLYTSDPDKRGILIYAVADFAGANNLSRPVENYPKSTYMTRGDRAALEKKQKAEAKERARAARMNLGEGRLTKTVSAPPTVEVDPEGLPQGFLEANQALVYVTED